MRGRGLLLKAGDRGSGPCTRVVLNRGQRPVGVEGGVMS
jgi:hypothetical protein